MKKTSSPKPFALTMTTAIELHCKSLTVGQVNAFAHGCKLTASNDGLDLMARSNAIVLHAVERGTPMARSIEHA